MHFLGGGWEEGKGEEQVEKKSGEGGGGKLSASWKKLQIPELQAPGFRLRDVNTNAFISSSWQRTVPDYFCAWFVR